MHPVGLSTKELAQIRDTLSAGKRPRVLFTEAAGQIAGQVGHVVSLEDPASHEDWILVKFGADVLPFPPSDLAMAPRGAVKTATRKAEPGPPAAPAPPEPEFMIVRETVPPPRQEKKTPTMTEEEDTTTATAPAPRKPAAKAKAKPLPSFTVTLTYTEGEWMVGAIQGTKTLAKPYVIKPAEALKMVSMLDVPGVQEAVDQIMASERAEAQAHAEKLRAELAELEAKLADLGAA